MENTAMDSLAIEKTLELRADPERVWAALTDPAQLGAWFPERVDGLDGTPDGWLVWDAHGRFAIRVVESERPRRLVWTWARESDTALDEGPTTTVEWTLQTTESGGTRLHLRESGFLTREAREQNDGGWDQELGELVEHLAA